MKKTAKQLDAEIATALKAKTTEYLGQCDLLRRKGLLNEAKWQEMMAKKQPISFKAFTSHVDMSPMLDEDDTPKNWLAEHLRSDPTTKAYRSWWGDVRCWFIQTAGFEFIFLERAK